MAILSPFIHLLQQRSFRRSGTETCAGRSATPRKLSSLAAHLFDARRTLPPHSCQVPQCWAVGRTNGMKRSFFGAVAAARGRTEHSNDDFSGFGEAQCIGPWVQSLSLLQLCAAAGRRVMEGTQPSTAGGDGAPTAIRPHGHRSSVALQSGPPPGVQHTTRDQGDASPG